MISAHTIAIGAGPAGLAVGACLKRAGIPCLILEQSHAVGPAWHQHYDRLHLHIDKAHSELPFGRFPSTYPRYPSRLQVIEYLERYADALRPELRFGQRVEAARRAEPFRNHEVLVVGFGNSGGEIAIDLCEHAARVVLGVRGPVNVIPRELFGIPILSIGILQSRLPPRVADALHRPLLRAVIGDLTPCGLRRSHYGTMTQIRRHGRIPLIDVGTIGLIKRGRIGVRPGIEAFTDDGVRFTDGSWGAFDTVILATGYRPRVDAFLEGASAALDAGGTPTSSGPAGPIPGLCFCGFHVSPTGMLREIGREATGISAAIARERGAATHL